MSEPVSVRARLEALRDAIYRSHFAGTHLAIEVESMEHAYSIEKRGVSQADFLVPTSDQTGRNLAEPLDESGLRTTLRLCRARCVWRVLELRKWIDGAFKAVRQAADLVNDPNAAPEQRWSAQIVRELQTLRGAILVGHDPTCQPSALPMIRAGVPKALRQAVAPLEPRFDRVKSLILELCGDASETGEDSNPTGPADSPAAQSGSGGQSSLGPPARRETATIPTRAGSDDRVVPTGGGLPSQPDWESTPDGQLRAALYTLARNLDPESPVSAGSIIRSHVENRLRQMAANQSTLNSPLGETTAASWPTPGIESPTHMDRIRSMLYFPCATETADRLREKIVRRVQETIDRAVRAVDNGAGLRLEALTAGKQTAAELAALLVELGDVVGRWGAGLDKAEAFDANLPARVFAIASIAGRAATLLGRNPIPPQAHSVSGTSTDVSPSSNLSVSPDVLDRLERGIAAVHSIESNFHAGVARMEKVIESKNAQDEGDPPSVKLPELKVHDRQAWQLATLHGMTQDKVAAALNKEHGTTYTQGQVSRMIARAKAHAEANGLAEKVAGPIDRARTVDPGRLELGAREDKRTPRPSDMARANDDDE